MSWRDDEVGCNTVGNRRETCVIGCKVTAVNLTLPIFSMTRPEEFTLAAARSVATHSLWAKEKLIPDGTMSTPFGDRVQAKFKTEQAFRTGRYRALAGSLGLTG